MFKKLVVFWISASLIYSPVVMAQAAALAGYELFMAKVTTFGATTVAYATNGAVLANGVRTFSAPTFSAGGAAVTTAARVAVGAGSAAVSVVGSASGPAVFSAFRALTGGPLGLALLASPLIINWLSQGGVQQNPAPTPEKPFALVIQGWSGPYGGTFPSPKAACDSGGWGPSMTVVYYWDEPNSARCSNGAGSNYARIEKIGSPSLTPASMDDIASYMDIPTPPAVFKALLDAGAKIEVVPRFINGPEYVSLPKTVEVTETPTTTTTKEITKGVKLEYKTGTDPVTGQPAPYVQAKPEETVVVKERDKATGVEKVVSTTETKTDEKPKPTENPDLCALHPEIVACAMVDQVDMCKVYPESLACQKTDEPEVPDLEEKEKPITFTPDTGWGPSTGSCPAPRPLSSAAGAAFTFQPYCDFMSAIRPVLVGVAWFSGAMILVGANRKD